MASTHPEPVRPNVRTAPTPQQQDLAPPPTAAAKPVPDSVGAAMQAAVKDLHAKLTALAAEHKFQVSELRNFGLEFDVFDPVTGSLTSPARAHRRDVGRAGNLVTADSVLTDMEASRRHQAAIGVTPPAAA